MSQYLPLLVMLALGIVFVAGSLGVSAVLAPHKRPSDAKLAPYECGIVPEAESSQRFPVRFYLVAMIFVIFDIEVVFMYPFAVVFHQLGVFGLVEVLSFSATVFGALLFLVSEGALTWGPVKHLVRAMPARTTASTIQRVGDESERVA